MDNRVFSVGQINSYVRNLIAGDYLLKRVSVKGEVSNCKYHGTGHIYFTLKDEIGAIACVMFAGDRASGLGFRMKDGDKVVVTGSVNVYVKDGRYQLYAKKIELVGAGLLYERYLALKQELEDEGLFAPEHKKPIPGYVRELGIVTAPTGAAVQDIRNISLRRNPYIQLYLYPALVQGEGAVQSIVTGIRTLDQLGLDCIIVGRGGGSIEDLWAFNEEAVVRAVYECETPVISAVGHETDTTIVDFAADLRAPTPSAAAELAVPNVRDLLRRFSDTEDRLNSLMLRNIRMSRQQLAGRQNAWKFRSPEQQIREKRQHLSDLYDRLNDQMLDTLDGTKRDWNERRLHFDRRMEHRMTDSHHRLELLLGRYDGLSPIRKLQQGYSYVENAQGKNISSVEQVKPEDSLQIQVTDGVIYAKVISAQGRQSVSEESDL